MKEKQVGEVSVDSGQILICDPCYLRDHGLSEELCDEIYQATIGKNLCGPAVNTQMRNTDKQFPLGFATRTGYGDGGYKVFVKHNGEGRVAEIKIVFIRETE